MKTPKWAGRIVKGASNQKAVIKGNHYVLMERKRPFDTTGRRICRWEEKGLILPDRVVRPIPAEVSDIRIYEYGFSKALFDLCPTEWKNRLGDDWYEVLLYIINMKSPSSFFLRNHEPGQGRRYYGMHCELLEKMIGIELDELLERLGSICLIQEGDRLIMTRPDGGQYEYARKLQICLEEIV